MFYRVSLLCSFSVNRNEYNTRNLPINFGELVYLINDWYVLTSIIAGNMDAKLRESLVDPEVFQSSEIRVTLFGNLYEIYVKLILPILRDVALVKHTCTKMFRFLDGIELSNLLVSKLATYLLDFI